MSYELTVLVLSALLQILIFAGFAITANLQLGVKTTLGRRDAPIQLTGTAARFQRTMNNHFEGMILFAIAAIAITLADKSSGFTAGCATVYLIARILYVPAYVFGLTPWRSFVWFPGFLATALMLIAALL